MMILLVLLRFAQATPIALYVTVESVIPNQKGCSCDYAHDLYDDPLETDVRPWKTHIDDTETFACLENRLKDKKNKIYKTLIKANVLFPDEIIFSGEKTQCHGRGTWMISKDITIREANLEKYRSGFHVYLKGFHYADEITVTKKRKCPLSWSDGQYAGVSDKNGMRGDILLSWDEAFDAEIDRLLKMTQELAES